MADPTRRSFSPSTSIEDLHTSHNNSVHVSVFPREWEENAYGFHVTIPARLSPVCCSNRVASPFPHVVDRCHLYGQFTPPAQGWSSHPFENPQYRPGKGISWETVRVNRIEGCDAEVFPHWHVMTHIARALYGSLHRLVSQYPSDTDSCPEDGCGFDRVFDTVRDNFGDPIDHPEDIMEMARLRPFDLENVPVELRNRIRGGSAARGVFRTDAFRAVHQMHTRMHFGLRK